MAGYAAKDFSRSCLLKVSANIVEEFCRTRGGGEVAESSLVCTGLGTFFGEGLVGGTFWGGMLPVPTLSQRIAYFSPVVATGMCGVCGAVGVFVPVLAAAIPWRLLMIF